MKWKFIIIILAVLIILTLFLLNFSSNPVSECIKESDTLECLKSLKTEQLNCNHAKEDRYCKGLINYELAFRLNDSAYCNESLIEIQNDCWKYFAYKNGNVSYCERIIKTARSKDETYNIIEKNRQVMDCISTIIRSNKNVSYCENQFEREIQEDKLYPYFVMNSTWCLSQL